MSTTPPRRVHLKVSLASISPALPYLNGEASNGAVGLRVLVRASGIDFIIPQGLNREGHLSSTTTMAAIIRDKLHRQAESD